LDAAYALGRSSQAGKHKPEEIVAKLRQVDVLTAQGTPVEEAVARRKQVADLQLNPKAETPT
jgi:hypothetical protein